jgi:hypothetical protein
LDAAEAGVRGAESNAQAAADKLAGIIRRAKELRGQHEEVARKAAQALKDATKDLAPHKPGLLSRMFHAFTGALSAVGDWVKDHLKDIHAVLSTISAIAGLVALITPPPVDAIALGVSVVAGAGALATDLADPQFRHGIGELLHGKFNKESLGALVTGVGDVASVIPGASVGIKALTGTRAAAEGTEGAGAMAKLITGVAKKPGAIPELAGHAGKGLAKIPGVAKVADAVSGTSAGGKVLGTADRILRLGDRDVEGFKALNRLNLVWKTKGALSHLYHDVKEATA